MAVCLCTNVRDEGSKTASGDFGSTGPDGSFGAGRYDLDSTAAPVGFARMLPLDNFAPSTPRAIWCVLTGWLAAFWTDCWVLRMSALTTPDEVWGRDVEAILCTASVLTFGPPNQPDWGAALCLAADAGDIGREKLTEERLPASWSSSSTCGRFVVARCPRPPGLGPAPLSRLTPRPLGVPLVFGEAPRRRGSRLEARRCPEPGILAGMAGTGGAFGLAGSALPGDGLRKVRSVIDPELDCRCRPPGRCWPLLFDDCELRRSMRLVIVSPTGGGVMTCVRNAAAAAALERFGFDSRSLTKAWAAARDADGLALAFESTREGCIAIIC